VPLVLDASLAVGCLFADEATDAKLEALRTVAKIGAWVPALWHLEVVNALRIGVRRGRCSEVFVDESLAKYARLPIMVDPETDARAWTETLHIARAEGLTIYDASYLELAIRRALPLASSDKALVAAASRRDVELIATA
jgi:predicted nucleic acid-binding protein